MKTNIILIALFVAANILQSNVSVDTEDAETEITQYANWEANTARPACEAAAHGKSAPANLDDTLTGVQRTSGSAGLKIMVCSSDHKIFTSHGDCDGVPIPISVDNLAPGNQIIDLSAILKTSPECVKKRISRYGSKKDMIAAFKCNQITK